MSKQMNNNFPKNSEKQSITFKSPFNHFSPIKTWFCSYSLYSLLSQKLYYYQRIPMKKNYSHDHLFSTGKKSPSNKNTFTNSFNQSPIKSNPFRFPQTTHTILSLQLQSIYTIINIHFPQYFEALNSSHSSQLLTNWQQLLNNFCKYIKDLYTKLLQSSQNQLISLQSQLNFTKQQLTNKQQKNAYLQQNLKDKQQKMKLKQSNSYLINQQLFQIKHKNQQLQKQLIIKNLNINQIYLNFQKFKQQAYTQITKYQDSNTNVKKNNIKLQQQLKHLTTKLQTIQAEQNKKINYQQLKLIKQISNTSSPYFNITSEQGTFTHHNNSQMNTFSAYNCNCFAKDYPVFRASSPAIMSSHTNMINKHYDSPPYQRPKSNEQLLNQIKKLKKNQSTLLDRIAQRDEHIQQLQNIIGKQSQLQQQQP